MSKKGAVPFLGKVSDVRRENAVLGVQHKTLAMDYYFRAGSSFIFMAQGRSNKLLETIFNDL